MQKFFFFTKYPLISFLLVVITVTAGCLGGSTVTVDTPSPDTGSHPDPFTRNVTAEPFTIPGMTTPVKNTTPYQSSIQNYLNLTHSTPAGLFLFNNTIPDGVANPELTITIFGESYTVSLQNLNSRVEGYALYAGHLNDTDPATAFLLSFEDGNSLSTFIGWKNISLRITPITGGDQPVHLVSLLTGGEGDPEPLGPAEIRLTRKPVLLGCPTGEIFHLLNDSDFARYPALKRLYNAENKTAVIADRPVSGYAVFLTPAEADEIFAAYGTHPADGRYQTYPWVHQFLSIDRENYFLEKGGIGLAPYIYTS